MNCKGCGKKIQYARLIDENGIPILNAQKKAIVVPLDPKPPVYDARPDGTCYRLKDAMVSHFATCPKASQFSEKGSSSHSEEPHD